MAKVENKGKIEVEVEVDQDGDFGELDREFNEELDRQVKAILREFSQNELDEIRKGLE